MKVTTAEFIKNYGTIADKALTEPITITKNGRDRFVLVEAGEWEKRTRENFYSELERLVQRQTRVQFIELNSQLWKLGKYSPSVQFDFRSRNTPHSKLFKRWDEEFKWIAHLAESPNFPFPRDCFLKLEIGSQNYDCSVYKDQNDPTPIGYIEVAFPHDGQGRANENKSIVETGASEIHVTNDGNWGTTSAIEIARQTLESKSQKQYPSNTHLVCVVGSNFGIPSSAENEWLPDQVAMQNYGDFVEECKGSQTWKSRMFPRFQNVHFIHRWRSDEIYSIL